MQGQVNPQIVRFSHFAHTDATLRCRSQDYDLTLNRLRTIPTWIAVLTGGSLLVTLYFIVQGELAHALIYSLIGLTAATLILIRARTLSNGRLPWLLLGTMQLLWAAGDLTP